MQSQVTDSNMIKIVYRPASDIEKLQAQVERNEHLIHVGEVSQHMEAIRSRLSEVKSGPEVRCYLPFVPPKGYGIPSLGTWKRWLVSRVGGTLEDFRNHKTVSSAKVFMLNENWHVLCVCCGLPTPLHPGRQVLGTHDKRTITDSSQSKVTVGALVKWEEDEPHINWHLGSTQEAEVEIEEKKVIRVVTHSALACIECQSYYLKLKAEKAREHKVALEDWTNKNAELIRLKGEYFKNCRALNIVPDPRLVKIDKSESPRLMTAFILVNVRQIEVEKTVEYWRKRGEV